MLSGRGAITTGLLLTLGGLVVGGAVGFRLGHHPGDVPAQVTKNDTAIAVLVQHHSADSTAIDSGFRALLNDSILRVTRLAFDSGQRHQRTADQIARDRLAIVPAGTTVPDSLALWQNLSYSFNSENIQLRLAIQKDTLAYLTLYKQSIENVKGAAWLYSKWIVSEGELSQERALRDKNEKILKAAMPRSWSIGLGADAIVVPGPTLCGASVAGIRGQVRTRGWLQLEGHGTAGYGAAGCASGKMLAGPAMQMGGSISL